MKRMMMMMLLSLILLNSIICISSAPSSSHLRGLDPLEGKYLKKSKPGVIKCKDGLTSFTIDRFNDDFCDCLDGTDEPGTSACPRGKFYCKNLGSRPQFLFSSRVNDHICDCCDGSDEYDGVTHCPNTCIMGGSIEYKTEYHENFDMNKQKESKPNGRFDMIQSLKDLKVLALIQLVIFVFWLLWFVYRRAKSRKRRYLV